MLALAVMVAIWWAQHEPGERVQVAAPAAPAAKAPTILASKVALVPQAPVRTADWVQSESDRAWCRLQPSELPASDARTPEEIKQSLASNPARKEVETESERLRAAWAARLRASGDERSQAAADLVENTGEARFHLMDLARHSSDPVVYGWAMAVCKGSDCGLSARRWAQLDPGNARPWIWEADRARADGDPQALREAIYQIGLTQRNEDYGRLWTQQVLGLAEAGEPGLQMNVEVTMPIGTLAAWPYPTRGLNEYCVWAGAAVDPARRSVCQAAADALWNSAETVFDASLAEVVARRQASADPERWRQRHEELQALSATWIEWLSRAREQDGEASGACAGLRALKVDAERRAAIGELAHLRQLHDKSPS